MSKVQMHRCEEEWKEAQLVLTQEKGKMKLELMIDRELERS